MKLPPKPKPSAKQAAHTKDFEALWKAYVAYFEGNTTVEQTSLDHGFTGSRLRNFIIRFDLPFRDPRISRGAGNNRIIARSRAGRSRNDKYGTDATRLNLP